jgi:ribonuclease HI
MLTPARPKITIYTDGACAANGTAQSRGGWAAVLVCDGTDQATELSGGERPATNQRMEIRAVIEGMKALKSPCDVTVHSDSAYVISCMNKRWFDNWRRNGWLNSSKKPVANRELWEELLDAVEAVESGGHTVSFEKVTGHANLLGRASSEAELYNQRCDELAVIACPAL